MATRKQFDFDPKNFRWLLPLHAFASFFMVGVILFVQIVYFPLYRVVDAHVFIDFQSQSILRLTPFLGPIMLVELITALGLFLTRLHPLWIMNFFLVLCIWVITGFWLNPMLGALPRNHDPELLNMIVSANFWRALVWLLHSLLVLFALVANREFARKRI